MKNLKVLFLTWMLVLGCASALAKDLVRERAIFEDATGQLTLAQVKGAAFAPAGEVVFEGFTRSALWVRLTVNVPAGAGPLSVRLRPTLLDSATLYYPAASAGGPVMALDMNARSAQKDTRIELQPGMNTVFLRAEAIGAMLIKAQVLLPQDALDQDLNEQLELGAVLAVYALLTVAMVGLVLWRRDSLGVFFFGHLLACLVLYVLVFGFFETSLAVDWLHGKTASRLSAIVNFLSFCLLMQAVQGFAGMQRLQRLTRFAAAGFVVLIALFFVADRHLVLKFTALVGPLVSLVLLTTLVRMATTLLKDKKVALAARLMSVLIVSVFVVMVCRAMLQLLKVVDGGAFLLQSPAWRGVFIPLGLMAFLWWRDREFSQALVQRQIEQAVAQMQVKEQAQRLATQSQFMAMLMHELKTPLYTIQLASTSLSRHVVASHPDTQRLHNITRAVDDLNFIIDRCVQAEQLDQSDLQANKTPVALKTLLSEVKHIDGYERVRCTGVDQAKVVTDYQYARIILINLVTNALKYSPPDTLVQLTVEPAQGGTVPGLRVRVSNAVGSAGWPDPLQVFTRYYRAEGAKKQVGAGLGLWLAHTIASKLGTDLRCTGDDERVHFEFMLELS